MLISAVARIVGFCTRLPWLVIALALLAAVGSAAYTATHFAITTDVNKLISPDLDWRKREAAYDKAFPGPFGTTLAVVEAPTAELASQASAELVQRLAPQTTLFHSVRDLAGGAFFARYALLFQSADELERTTKGLGMAGPLIEALANDPSLRGLTRALSFGLIGVQTGQAKLDDLQRPLSMSADTLDNVLADRPATFSWREMVSGRAPDPQELRHFVEVRPVLDYSALEPGRVSSDAIRKAVSDLDLAGKYQARVRLTGTVPMADEEFATVQQGALVNGIATLIVVLVILWLALRSARIIAAVFINMFVGLSITAALGLMMVHALNMISVAFAVLFIGLGVDFGIQFAVRYRTERHEIPNLRDALTSAASKIGAPLTLAAAAVAAGFLSFLPTNYKGVSELGEIAGAGMLIAYFTSITLLPALLAVFNPPGEPAEIGYRALAPVDRFLQRYRYWVIGGTILVALLGTPLLYHLAFDFNPINLRSKSVESVATFLDLRSDPNLGANAINVVQPTLKDAVAAAAELRKLPEVRRAMTLQDLVPQDQDRKLAMIQALRRQLEPVLQSKKASAPPSDAQNVAALNGAADALLKTAGTADTIGAKAAKRLADDLTRLAKADKSLRDKAEAAFIPPLKTTLAGLQYSLQAEPIAADHMPPELTRQWMASDGRARIEVSPNGDPNDNDTVRAFARVIQAKYPGAVGTPISILESGNTVVAAFFQAGTFALISIAILLWIVLRRIGDVLLTLLPLLLAGLITLEVCVLVGLPLNFANIIALPVLLGVGVAFKIYYIMAWRAGQTNLLQSALTRAVIWSALTTATAFGSLWLSSHPGTSSMGKLLALSLVCTLCAAVLFQPALMGAPRSAEKPEADVVA